MLKKCLFTIFVLVTTFVYIHETLAVGLSVRPSEFTLSGDLGKGITASFRVKNLSTDVALFEAYPDQLESAIKLNPSSFTLQSGEEREVEAKINLREKGRFETTLSVTARPLSPLTFQAGAGVKIPLHISIGEGSVKGLAAIGLLVKDNLNYIALGIFLILLAVFAGKIRRRS